MPRLIEFVFMLVVTGEFVDAGMQGIGSIVRLALDARLNPIQNIGHMVVLSIFTGPCQEFGPPANMVEAVVS